MCICLCHLLCVHIKAVHPAHIHHSYVGQGQGLLQCEETSKYDEDIKNVCPVVWGRGGYCLLCRAVVSLYRGRENGAH